MTVRLTLDEVHALALHALVACGTSEANAAVVADSIRDAEAEDLRNVGLAYLPVYCEHARCGKVDGRAVPVVEQAGTAAVRVDARHGFCHPAFVAAEARLVALAREAGIAVLAITRSSSAGVVGWFSDRLARAGLVSLAFANASALMAPWGGTRPFFGTNPLALGAPRAGGPPLVVDLSSSTTAYVNVVDAAARGEPIPPAWAVDAEGRPTTDAAAALAGAMSPLGGAKGMCLAIMVDVLAAGVTGSRWSFEASGFVDNAGGPPEVGQLFIAIDAARLGGAGLPVRLDAMLAAMCEQPGVRIPGDRRHAARERAGREGVAVDEALRDRLLGYCA